MWCPNWLFKLYLIAGIQPDMPAVHLWKPAQHLGNINICQHISISCLINVITQFQMLNLAWICWNINLDYYNCNSQDLLWFHMSPQRVCSFLLCLHWSVPHLQMSPKITWVRAGKVTLIAFVGLFPTVCFHMSPQSACLNRCIVTLIAFVWLFSTVCFQMSLQMVCMRGCIYAL